MEKSHLHGEIASSDLPGVEGDPSAGLEQPLHLWPGVGLQEGQEIAISVVQHLSKVEQNGLLTVDQRQLTQTLNLTISNSIQIYSIIYQVVDSSSPMPLRQRIAPACLSLCLYDNGIRKVTSSHPAGQSVQNKTNPHLSKIYVHPTTSCSDLLHQVPRPQSDKSGGISAPVALVVLGPHFNDCCGV